MKVYVYKFERFYPGENGDIISEIKHILVRGQIEMLDNCIKIHTKQYKIPNMIDWPCNHVKLTHVRPIFIV